MARILAILQTRIYIFIKKKATFQVKPQQTRVYLYKYCCINNPYKILTLSKFIHNLILKYLHVCKIIF